MNATIEKYTQGNIPFTIPIRQYRREKTDIFSFWARCLGLFLHSERIYNLGVEYYKLPDGILAAWDRWDGRELE